MFINDYSHYHPGLFYIMRTPAGGETNIRAVSHSQYPSHIKTSSLTLSFSPPVLLSILACQILIDTIQWIPPTSLTKEYMKWNFWIRITLRSLFRFTSDFPQINALLRLEKKNWESFEIDWKIFIALKYDSFVQRMVNFFVWALTLISPQTPDLPAWCWYAMRGRQPENYILILIDIFPRQKGEIANNFIFLNLNLIIDYKMWDRSNKLYIRWIIRENS